MEKTAGVGTESPATAGLACQTDSHRGCYQLPTNGKDHPPLGVRGELIKSSMGRQTVSHLGRLRTFNCERCGSHENVLAQEASLYVITNVNQHGK